MQEIEDIELTTKIMTKFLQCSKQYISELVRKGKLRVAGKEGKQYTFKLQELSKFMPSDKYDRLLVKVKEKMSGAAQKGA